MQYFVKYSMGVMSFKKKKYNTSTYYNASKEVFYLKIVLTLWSNYVYLAGLSMRDLIERLFIVAKI